MAPIHFNYQKRTKIDQAKNLKLFLVEVLNKEKKFLSQVNFIFCSDDFLLEINKNFLQHDYYTDIITFDLSTDNSIIGEIYISIDRVKENAQNFTNHFQQELRRVILHGVLHLIGYEDKTKREITAMRSKEDYYLHLFEKKFNAGK